MLEVLSKQRDCLQIEAQKKEIEKEIGKVEKLTKQHESLMKQWQNAAMSCNSALKELGDFENYFQILNEDANKIAEMLTLFEERQANRQPDLGSAR